MWIIPAEDCKSGCLRKSEIHFGLMSQRLSASLTRVCFIKALSKLWHAIACLCVYAHYDGSVLLCVKRVFCHASVRGSRCLHLLLSCQMSHENKCTLTGTHMHRWGNSRDSERSVYPLKMQIWTNFTLPWIHLMPCLACSQQCFALPLVFWRVQILTLFFILRPSNLLSVHTVLYEGLNIFPKTRKNTRVPGF